MLQGLGSLGHTITVEHLHDLGKLLFAFVVFWAYIAFSQYFLIWYANLPEETQWYITRRTGDWNVLSWGLVFGHFLVPFVILLFRAVRRDPFWLGFIAAWILVFHYLDLYWLVMPALQAVTVAPSLVDLSISLTVILLFGALVSLACQAPRTGSGRRSSPGRFNGVSSVLTSASAISEESDPCQPEPGAIRNGHST